MLGNFAEKGFSSLFGPGEYKEEAEAVPFDVEKNSVMSHPVSNYSHPSLRKLAASQTLLLSATGNT